MKRWSLNYNASTGARPSSVFYQKYGLSARANCRSNWVRT